MDLHIRSVLAVVVLLTLLVAPCSARAQGRNATHDSAYVPVLTYHHIKLNKPSDNAIERGLTVLPKEFASQLDYLARNHFHAISASTLVRFLHSGGRLPTKPIVLTFDDGYKDVWHNAFAQLRRKKMTATFFIVPGFLGSPRYLTWSEVKYMSTHGMDIEAHSMTHPDLTTLSPSHLKTEVAQSKQVLESHLHHTIRVFAYPYGAFDATVVSAVIRAGYWGAFTTRAGPLALRSRLFTLPRLHVNQGLSLSTFGSMLGQQSCQS